MTSRRALTRLICGVALTCAAAACAVKQPPPAADALAGALPPTTSVPAAWKASGNVPGTVATEWVATFADPQLDALVEEGLRHNLDLMAAAARVDVAAALVVQARSLLYPQISLVAGTGVVGRDTTRDRSGFGAEIGWELDLWARVRAQGASAEAARQATAAD